MASVVFRKANIANKKQYFGSVVCNGPRDGHILEQRNKRLFIQELGTVSAKEGGHICLSLTSHKQC